MDTFEEGKQAYKEGQNLSCCPYPENSEEAIEWEGGWMEAEEDDD